MCFFLVAFPRGGGRLSKGSLTESVLTRGYYRAVTPGRFDSCSLRSQLYSSTGPFHKVSIVGTQDNRTRVDLTPAQ
jgi:hypothetical protein